MVSQLMKPGQLNVKPIHHFLNSTRVILNEHLQNLDSSNDRIYKGLASFLTLIGGLPSIM